MNQAFIALGTNIEPREKYLNQALELLTKDREIVIVTQSSIYQTVPVGYTDQPDFLNMVIEIKTSYCAIDLLNTCQKIELDLGRKRTIRFGPRTIDLDILLYNQENRHSERLIIPHPRMHERAFVLTPLKEISPDLYVPKIDKYVSDLIKELSTDALKDVRLYRKSTK